MPDFDDLRIRERDEQPLTTPPTSSRWMPVAIVVVLAVVAIGAYWFFKGRTPIAPPPAAATSQPPPVEAPPPRAPLAAGEAPAELPPLDSSDDAVRDLVRQATNDPLIAAWLTTSGLLRQVASGLQAVAGGLSPARRLPKLAPQGRFRARSSGGRLTMDPENYTRYDAVATAVTSIDPAAAARLYGAVKPRLEEAIRDLGVTGVTTDEYVERAIRQLLSAPVLQDPPALVDDGGVYRYADPRLESLPPAQKQMLRMGPENTTRIQNALRAIAHALGIPDERLPQPTQ